MTTLYEGLHTGEYMLSDADESISRDQVTVAQTGAALVSGTVLGKVTATGKYVPYNNSATDGSEVAAGILYTPLPAATGDVKATVHVRLCEVSGAALVGLDTPAIADLKAAYVIVR